MCFEHPPFSALNFLFFSGFCFRLDRRVKELMDPLFGIQGALSSERYFLRKNFDLGSLSFSLSSVRDN